MKAFGDRLKQAREAKSVSIRAVANTTRISERYLEALERSDLEALPGGVFDKGYIKAYAQFLDIDAKPLLESYRIEERKAGRGTPEAEREKLEELARLVRSGPRPPSRGPGVPLVALAGLVLASLIGASAWWAFRSPPPAPKARPLAEESATVTRSLAVEAPVEEPDADAEPPSPAPALTIPQLGVGTGIVDRNLVGRNDRFPEGAKVWLWTRVVGGESGDRIRHVWSHQGRVYMNATLRVGASHWRTYSTLELPVGTAGEWTIEVRTLDGTVLASDTFECVTPRGGT